MRGDGPGWEDWACEEMPWGLHSKVKGKNGGAPGCANSALWSEATPGPISPAGEVPVMTAVTGATLQHLQTPLQNVPGQTLE